MAATATATPKKKKRKAPARTAAQKKADLQRLGAINAHVRSLKAGNPSLGHQAALKLAGTAWKAGELGGTPAPLGAGAPVGELGKAAKKKKPKDGRRAPRAVSPRRVSDLQRFLAPFVLKPAVTKLGVNVGELKEAAAALVQMGRLYGVIASAFPGTGDRTVLNLFFEPQVRDAIKGLPLRSGAKRIFERFLVDRNVSVSAGEIGVAVEFLSWLNEQRDTKGNPIGGRIVIELLKDLDTTRRALGLPAALGGTPGNALDQGARRLVQVVTAEFGLVSRVPDESGGDLVPGTGLEFPSLKGGFGRMDGEFPEMEMGRGFPAIDEVEAMGFPQTAGVDYAESLGQAEFDVDDIQSLIEGDLDTDLDSLLFAGLGQGDDVFDEFETLETLELLGLENRAQPRLALGQTLEELDAPLDLPVAGYELGQEIEAGPEVPTIERPFDEGELMVPGLEGQYGQQGPGTVDAFFDPITNPDEVPLQPTPTLFGTDPTLFGTDDEYGQQQQAQAMMVPEEDEEEDIEPFFEGLDTGGLGQADFGSDEEEETSGFA